MLSTTRKLFPYAVLQRLHQMTKSGNRSIQVKFGYLENDEDQNGKVIEVTRWRLDTIGAVAAPEALGDLKLRDISQRLDLARTACSWAEASPDRTDTEMRAWSESIEGLDRCEVDLSDAESAVASFTAPANLRALCWLCTKDEDQIQTARAALRLSGTPRASKSDAHKARNVWRNELRASRNDAEFRIP